LSTPASNTEESKINLDLKGVSEEIKETSSTFPWMSPLKTHKGVSVPP